MTHSYKKHFFHLIWSTKNRVPYISNEIQSRLYQYLSAMANERKAKIMEIGGMEDHLHILLEMNQLDKYTDLIRDLKACSSMWIHRSFINSQDFAWQQGHGSFSVSYSAIDEVRKYIQNQETHHKKLTFEEEYLKFLELHHIQYDKRFVLG